MKNDTILNALSAERLTPSCKWIFISGQSVEDAIEYTIAVLLCIYNFYPKFRTVFTTDEQLQVFRKLCKVPKKFVIKYQKYMTAEVPNCYLDQNDHNKVPDMFFHYMGNKFGYSGRIKKFLENRLYRKTGRNLAFWNSWLQGIKRACHEAGAETLFDNYVDHRNTMMQPPTGSISKETKTYIKRVAEVMTCGKPTLYEASTSASFTTKRSTGGQRADVRNWLMKHYGSGEVETFYENGKKYILHGPRIPDIKILAKDIAKDFIYQGESTWEMCKDGYYQENYSGKRHLRVKVHGILEPLKVRKITKGESVPYWFSRSTQKSMWSSLQKYIQFAPTGRPIERFDIMELIEREKAVNSKVRLDFNLWISGDYSAATDGVDVRVTMGIFEELLKNNDHLTDDMKDILRAVIGPQECYYPPVTVGKEKRQLEPVLQQNGQLMGSTLSFPLLCLINIITYWMTLEHYTGRVFKLNELPVIVNGDDILFRANEEFYDMWKNNIKKVGFTMSVGKNYAHPNIFLINSQMFWLHGDPYKKFDLQRVPMYNLGLLTGKAKTTGRDYDKVTPLWSWYNQVLDGACDKYDAHKRFLHYHKDNVRRMTCWGKRNLFIDRWFGGCGFKLYPEVRDKVKFTTYQRKLARWLRWETDLRGRKGFRPSDLVLRLVQEEASTSASDKTYLQCMSIDLGFYDTYRIKRVSEPLRDDESLDLKRQHNLPLLAQLPTTFDKRPLEIKWPKLPLMSTLVNKRDQLKNLPAMKIDDIVNQQYRLVAVHEHPVSWYLNLEPSYEDSRTVLRPSDDQGIINLESEDMTSYSSSDVRRQITREEVHFSSGVTVNYEPFNWKSEVQVWAKDFFLNKKSSGSRIRDLLKGL